MRSYLKMSIWATVLITLALIVTKSLLTLYNPLTVDPPTIFLLISGLILLYTLGDFFFSYSPSEIHGEYRHLPILVSAVATSIVAIIILIPVFSGNWVPLAVQSGVLLISTIFMLRSIFVPLIENRKIDSFNIVADLDELNGLFWSIMAQLAITGALLILINAYL